MFHGVFRTKERKVISAILGFILVVIVITVFGKLADSGQAMEQAVMAENYLKAGNYEQAIEAYQKALSFKESDMEALSIGLSDSYIGLNDYDKALEVLNSCYQKTSGIKIKIKIEEVMSAKTDYEYLQSISRGEVYYSNEEYDKAITEFEKAKLIDSKEITSYQKITMAYVKQGKYDLAREEVIEGQAFTKSEELDKTMEIVDSYLNKDQYDTMIAQAEEYIFQENYDDGIKVYQDAIKLLPTESSAYIGLAGAYIAQENYSRAVSLLQEVKATVNNKQLDNLLTEAVKLKENKDKKNHMLSNLYTAMKTKDIDTVKKTMETDFFKEQTASGTPIYYGVNINEMTQKYAMIIYDSTTVYFGEIINGLRKGTGIYFTLYEDEDNPGYYYYEGSWRSDIPNGEGKTVEWKVIHKDNGSSSENKVITEGCFLKANENGPMKKIFYADDIETGKLSYTTRKGIPLPVQGVDQLKDIDQNETYKIGELYLNGEPTGEAYEVEAGTIWGVTPLMAEDYDIILE